MKQHFDFLPTKSELATANNNWDTAILYNRVETFSVGRTTIYTRDLKADLGTIMWERTFPLFGINQMLKSASGGEGSSPSKNHVEIGPWENWHVNELFRMATCHSQ